MINRIITGVVLNGLTLYLIVKFLPDISYTGGILFFILGGIVIGSLNIFVKPLMKILTFPLMFLTSGLFSLVINGIIFWLTMTFVNVINVFDISVSISSIWTYVLGTILFGIVNWILHFIIHKK